jgi:hypothetical protein
MDRQQLLTIGSIVVIAIALMLWFRPFSGEAGGHGDNNANLPDGAWYICGDAACRHEWNMSIKELNAHYEATYGQARTQPPCPKCGKTDSVRADQCKSCGKVSLANQGLNCPICKQPMAGSGARQ